MLMLIGSQNQSVTVGNEAEGTNPYDLQCQVRRLVICHYL